MEEVHEKGRRTESRLERRRENEGVVDSYEFYGDEEKIRNQKKKKKVNEAVISGEQIIELSDKKRSKKS